jgi:polysaccharide biosynthesis protein PslG
VPRLDKRSLTAALACGLGLVLAAPAAAQQDFVGLASDDVFGGSPSYRSSNLARQRSAGVGLLRQNFDWASIERSRGRYSFAYHDEYVAAVARAGIRILPVLYNAPSFHSSAPRRGARRGLYFPRRAASMGRFAAALVRRYGPSGSFWRANPGVPKLPIRSWQIWNEPNLQVYSQPRPSARRYTRLLRTVARYIKKADSRAEVVTAGLPPSKLKTAIRLERFLKGMYRAGAKRGFDTLAVNAYAVNSRDLSRTVRRVRRIMRRYRDRGARVWITELGWATGGPRHRFNVGSAGQGQRIQSTFGWIARNRARYKLRGLVYFQWRDQRPYPPAYKDMWGLHTGLLTLGGQAKSALSAFSAAARQLR